MLGVGPRIVVPLSGVALVALAADAGDTGGTEACLLAPVSLLALFAEGWLEAMACDVV